MDPPTTKRPPRQWTWPQPKLGHIRLGISSCLLGNEVRYDGGHKRDRYLKRDLDGPDKAELVALIEEYRLGLVPLVVPLTLFRHHLARISVPYIQEQVYLNPHPKELMLRNHA